MKLLTLSLIAYGASIAASLSPIGPARAQDMPPPSAMSVSHGDWTLRQRETWVADRLEKSRADGSLERGEFERARRDLTDLRREEDHMRDAGHGQLTDNQTADLEGRLDAMADKVRWANVDTYKKPW